MVENSCYADVPEVWLLEEFTYPVGCFISAVLTLNLFTPDTTKNLQKYRFYPQWVKIYTTVHSTAICTLHYATKREEYHSPKINSPPQTASSRTRSTSLQICSFVRYNKVIQTVYPILFVDKALFNVVVQLIVRNMQ